MRVPAELEREERRMRRRVAGLLRIVISLLLLMLIAKFIPAGEVWSRMKEVPPTLWLGVLLAFLTGHAFAAAKWRWMIGARVSYPRALKAHYAGLAANLALPGVAGGDLVRAGMVMRDSSSKAALVVGSLADRLIDSAALLLIAAAGALWLGAEAGIDRTGLVIAAALVPTAALAGVLLLKPVAGRLRGGGALMGKIAAALEEMAARPGVLALCAALSIAIQASFAFLNAALASSLGVGASLAAWIFAWPLAKLIATLPISFGGLGVREASLAGLMAPLGAPSAGVVAASLVWQTILWAAGALGAALQVLWRRAPSRAEAAHG